MDKKNYEEQVKKLARGDFIFVHVHPEHAMKAGIAGIFGSLTQFGTGEYCHTEVYYGNKDGQKHTTLCANGDKVEWTCLDRYLASPETYTLTFKRLKGVTVDDQKAMETEMFRQIGKEYDRGQLIGLAIKGLLSKIPGFNFFVWKIPTPFASAEKYICSESAYYIARSPKIAGKPKYPVCNKYEIQSITPTLLGNDPLMEIVAVV